MARVEIYQPKADEFAQDLAFKKVKALVKVVAFEARHRAASYTGNSVPDPTGKLSRSIRSSVDRKGRWKVVGTVGSNHSKALLIHDGAKPHVIRPVNAGGLKFFWKEKGRFICIKGPVNHPGFRGKFYLTEPLRIKGFHHGFYVVTSTASGSLFR